MAVIILQSTHTDYGAKLIFYAVGTGGFFP
jgi:hypothetical protein